MVFHGRIDKPVVNRCLTLYFAPLKSNMEPPEKLAFAMERSAPIGVRGSMFILGRV